VDKRLACALLSASLVVGCGGKPSPVGVSDSKSDESATTAPANVPVAATPTGFDKTIEAAGFRFQVTSPNSATGNIVTVTPSGLEADNTSIPTAIDGDVVGAGTTYVGGDGSPELYVFVRSRAAKTPADSVLAFAVNNRKSLSAASIAPLADNPALATGYAGGDTYAVEGGSLVRRFPIVAGEGVAAGSVGRTRLLQYAPMPGEAGWKLQPVGGAIEEERVQFAAGTASAKIEGELKGDATVDYVVNGAAGQTLLVRELASGKVNFNVLPPGSVGGAMFADDGSKEFSAQLPDDGDYLVRVYLPRPAARRDEAGKYSLTIEVSGQPLAATPGASDALVGDTRFHATAKVPCALPYQATPDGCDVGVVRRGVDGTATVVLPSNAGVRTLLFVAGKPVASNASRNDALTFERKGDMTTVRLGAAESYEIPDALLTGG
jgi:hypothetical protein